MRFKCFLAAFIAASISMTAFADSKITSGDPAVLHDNSIVCKVVYDFAKTSIEDIPFQEYMEQKGEKFVKEWNEEVIPLGLEYYIKAWNKGNKNGLQVAEENDGEYRMVIAPSYINLGSTAAAVWIGFGAGGARFDGTISIYKGDTLILEILVDNQRAGSNVKARYRFAALMKELVKDTFGDVL